MSAINTPVPGRDLCSPEQNGPDGHSVGEGDSQPAPKRKASTVAVFALEDEKKRAAEEAKRQQEEDVRRQRVVAARAELKQFEDATRTRRGELIREKEELKASHQTAPPEERSRITARQIALLGELEQLEMESTKRREVLRRDLTDAADDLAAIQKKADKATSRGLEAWRKQRAVSMAVDKLKHSLSGLHKRARDAPDAFARSGEAKEQIRVQIGMWYESRQAELLKKEAELEGGDDSEALAACRQELTELRGLSQRRMRLTNLTASESRARQRHTRRFSSPASNSPGFSSPPQAEWSEDKLEAVTAALAAGCEAYDAIEAEPGAPLPAARRMSSHLHDRSSQPRSRSPSVCDGDDPSARKPFRSPVSRRSSARSSSRDSDSPTRCSTQVDSPEKHKSGFLGKSAADDAKQGTSPSSATRARRSPSPRKPVNSARSGGPRRSQVRKVSYSRPARRSMSRPSQAAQAPQKPEDWSGPDGAKLYQPPNLPRLPPRPEPPKLPREWRRVQPAPEVDVEGLWELLSESFSQNAERQATRGLSAVDRWQLRFVRQTDRVVAWHAATCRSCAAWLRTYAAAERQRVVCRRDAAEMRLRRGLLLNDGSAEHVAETDDPTLQFVILMRAELAGVQQLLRHISSTAALVETSSSPLKSPLRQQWLKPHPAEGKAATTEGKRRWQQADLLREAIVAVQERAAAAAPQLRRWICEVALKSTDAAAANDKLAGVRRALQRLALYQHVARLMPVDAEGKVPRTKRKASPQGVGKRQETGGTNPSRPASPASPQPAGPAVVIRGRHLALAGQRQYSGSPPPPVEPSVLSVARIAQSTPWPPMPDAFINGLRTHSPPR
eukprot:Hpha_TRINITY_DN324_c0_g1::TRINITY_DN324_c0_g1_i1::g.112629::m.112629